VESNSVFLFGGLVHTILRCKQGHHRRQVVCYFLFSCMFHVLFRVSNKMLLLGIFNNFCAIVCHEVSVYTRD
jgi:hypothetical protein